MKEKISHNVVIDIPKDMPSVWFSTNQAKYYFAFISSNYFYEGGCDCLK